MTASIQVLEKEFVNSLIAYRQGEEKLGQGMDISHDGSLNNFRGKFVIVGIPEDIGVRANHGMAGAYTAFHSFLQSFVNIQNTETLNGRQFFLLGQVDTCQLMQESQNANIQELRSLTQALDDRVCPVIQMIVSAGKIPIVIGGGHNNAFPILKGCSLALKQGVNAINLDAHTDFRTKEGRHSGNGFSYAYDSGFLKRYAMLGLHEAYNSDYCTNELRTNPDFLPLFFEDVFLRKKESWENAQQRAIDFVSDELFGVELDVDSVQNMLSSAWSPVGISARESLNYLYYCGKNKGAAYLHLAEAIYKRSDGQEDRLVGKLLSYMVQAFCKGVIER
ncbi:formiminoglutamase [Saccharicrinis carchari]|uniref:Formiminoglutamase n=1 Tax=Saccharicrinis carchari TaxID=1168039 RepID=A0A521DSR9_SACCC|nr:formimidoylglutamase [Saccharicrinis carchari]SMO74655.1 formiminoglutamase [Saccharicrinis carchari]